MAVIPGSGFHVSLRVPVCGILLLRQDWVRNHSIVFCRCPVTISECHRLCHPCSMTGFLQTSYYFAYSGLFCIGLGLLTGTIGFQASSVFVNRIYRNIKVD